MYVYCILLVHAQSVHFHSCKRQGSDCGGALCVPFTHFAYKSVSIPFIIIYSFSQFERQIFAAISIKNGFSHMNTFSELMRTALKTNHNKNC